jgi:small GTP-binding protein
MYDATYKVVIFGDSNTGKEVLTQRFLTNLFKSDTKMTIGVDFEVKSMEINDKKVKLQIWDFGGEERFRFLLPTYVRGANGALFIYNINNYSTLAHIDDWLLVVKSEIRSEKDSFPIVVVGIFSEKEDVREIPAEVAFNIAKSRGVDGFVECSPITGENVEETFEGITRLMAAKSRLI